MPGNESFTWNHVVVWSSDAIAQSFHLHFYDPKLYSGELFVPISNNKLPLNSLRPLFMLWLKDKDCMRANWPIIPALSSVTL